MPKADRKTNFDLVEKTNKEKNKMKLQEYKLSPAQAGKIQDALKLILKMNPRKGDEYGNMNCELWVEKSPFHGLFRISNTYDERGLLVDVRNRVNANAHEVYSQKEIQKRKS